MRVRSQSPEGNSLPGTSAGEGQTQWPPELPIVLTDHDVLGNQCPEDTTVLPQPVWTGLLVPSALRGYSRLQQASLATPSRILGSSLSCDSLSLDNG